MDFLIDAFFEFMPDVVGEWLSQRFNSVIERVKNPVMQKVLCVVAALLASVLSVAVAVGLLFLIGFVLFRVFKL